MRKTLPLLLLLFLPLPVHALGVKGAASYKPYDPIVLKADGVSPKAQLLWDVDAPAQLIECGADAHVWAPPGVYRVSLIAVDFDAKTIVRARFSFTVEGQVPPGPGPGPGPTPTKDLHVLILFESSAPLPAAQYGVIYGKEIRAWMTQVLPVGATSKKSTYRIWDKDSDPSGDEPIWATMMAKGAPKSIPWIVLSGGTEILFAGPLPADVAATKALIQKYLSAQQRKAA